MPNVMEVTSSFPAKTVGDLDAEFRTAQTRSK
jgi:hypothetical protein